VKFCIVSVGWDCAGVLERTLHSIDVQTLDNYEVMIIDDATEDPRQAFAIRSWCEMHDSRWHYRINPEHYGAVRNQWEAIVALNPAPDDVVVWLDLDGDQLAHPYVLADLAEEYADGVTLLTYGNYRPEPNFGTCPPAEPFPAQVIADNSYRAHIRSGGGCCFNHLRTMRGEVFWNIPSDSLRWPNGEWYGAGSDYLFMVNGLELAGPRHKCLSEVLLTYNNVQPHPDNMTHPDLTNRCVADMLSRPPLESLL
jgi:hypothetical protein